MNVGKSCLMLIMLVILQSNVGLAQEKGKDHSKYQLPTAVYDDSFAEPSSRRQLLTTQQMITKRAMKRATERRTRIAIQKMSGRSISRPRYHYSPLQLHSAQMPLSYYYYPHAWNYEPEIRYRTWLN